MPPPPNLSAAILAPPVVQRFVHDLWCQQDYHVALH